MTFLVLLALAVVAQCVTWRRLARGPRTALVATLGSYLGGAVLFAPLFVGARFGVQALCRSTENLLRGLEVIVPVAFVGPGACLILAGLASLAVLRRRQAQVSSPS